MVKALLLLVSFWCLLSLSYSKCFPDRPLPTGTPIVIAYPDRATARLNAEIAKVMIEELLGQKVSTVTASDSEAIQGIIDGKIHIYLDLWKIKNKTIERYLEDSAISLNGELGIRGKNGWYIPTYLHQYNEDLDFWRAYRKQENIDLLASRKPLDVNQKTNVEIEYENLIKSINDTLPSATYSQNLTNALVKVKEAIEALDGKGAKGKSGAILSPSLEEGFGYENELVTQLDLNLIPFHVPFPSEDSLVDEITDRYSNQEPFITFFWTPHQIFDPRSNILLTPVQLPEWNEDCLENSDLPQCYYPSDTIQKISASSLKRYNPRVALFVDRFKYRSNKDQIEMLADIFYEDYNIEDAACHWIQSNWNYTQTFVTDDIVYSKFYEVDGMLVASLAGIMMVITGIIIGIVVVFRNHRVVLASSQRFCFVILIGSLVGYASVFPFIGEPTRASCILRPLLICVSFVLMYSFMIIKTFRVWMIFRNPVLTSKMKLSDAKLAPVGIIALLIEIIILVVWFVVDPPVPTLINTQKTVIFTCKSQSSDFESSLTWFLFSFNGLFVLLGSLLAFSTRDVATDFNESRYIAISIYNVIAVCLITVPLISIPEILSFQGDFIILSLSIIIIVSFTTLTLFIPKTYHIWTDPGSTRNTRKTSSSFPSHHQTHPTDSANPKPKEHINEDILDITMKSLKDESYVNPF